MTGRCTSGTTPLRRSDTFSGGARRLGTKKPHANSDQSPKAEFHGRKNAVRIFPYRSFLLLTDGCFSISDLSEEGRSKQLRGSRPIVELSLFTPIKLLELPLHNEILIISLFYWDASRMSMEVFSLVTLQLPLSQEGFVATEAHERLSTSPRIFFTTPTPPQHRESSPWRANPGGCIWKFILPQL